MKDNKNIERLFQEKFKDFEALPPQDSWDIIASRLNEKKKKKRKSSTLVEGKCAAIFFQKNFGAKFLMTQNFFRKTFMA